MHPTATHKDTYGTGNMLEEVERGLLCAVHRHYTDAAAHFALARQQLPHTRTSLIAALEAFAEAHEGYCQAQEVLHEASQDFAVASMEQQKRLDNLEALLSGEVDQSKDAGLVEASLHQSPLVLNTARTPRLLHSNDSTLPMIRITCFGRFGVWRSGEQLLPCNNRNGQTILRYLSAHPRHRETIDALMEALWPDDPPEIARHKLHCATSALRRTLNGEYAHQKGAGYLVHENGFYGLNPVATIEIDADKLLAGYAAGQRAWGSGAIAHYGAACHLYTGPFLSEDIYADWSQIRREQLTQAYLTMCATLAAHYESNGCFDAAVGWTLKILEENRCDEAAYRRLMRAHAAAGRRGEALRLFRDCERVLAAELSVCPMPETTALFERIVSGETVPAPP